MLSSSCVQYLLIPVLTREKTLEKRPSLDNYFMELAHTVAKRSTCLRHNMGAVLVKEKHILSTGYNGAPKGLAHCRVTGCIRAEQRIPSGQRHELCRGAHAEANAIIQAAYHGTSTANSIMYSTHQPCSLCARLIINAGIREIVYTSPYNDALARDLLKSAGVKLRHVLTEQ